MDPLLLVLIVTSVLSILFITLTWKYRSYLNNLYAKIEKEEKEKSLDQLLDKYVIEEKKDVMKVKLAKISSIIAETEQAIEKTVEKKVKVAEAQVKAKGKEHNIITQAKDEFISFTAGFLPAMPTTEEERLADMNELKDALTMLESFDEESYRVGPKKVDAGVGMFYDKMSSRFNEIITEQKLNQYKFIPIQRIKYHVFQNVKNIKNADILPILNVMKDTKLLYDIIEINPAFHIVVLSEEKIKLTLTEKVLLTFVYDEDFLTVDRLLEITEWKEAYGKKILDGLVKKGIVTVLDENINTDGFGHEDERKKWNETIKEQIVTEKAKEEEKRDRQLKRAQQMRAKLAEAKKLKDPKSAEPKPEPVPEKTLEDTLDDLDSISATDVEPPKIKFDKKPGVKALPLPGKGPSAGPKLKEIAVKKSEAKDGLAGAIDALDDLITEDDEPMANGDTEGRDLEDLVPEKILNYHEKFSIVNGGLVQYEKLKEYVIKEVNDEVPDELLKAMLTQLQELQMVHSTLKFGNFDFYLFNEITFDFFEKRFITVCVDKAPRTREDLITELRWKEDRYESTIKSLQEKGLIKVEDDKVIIPAINQK